MFDTLDLFVPIDAPAWDPDDAEPSPVPLHMAGRSFAEPIEPEGYIAFAVAGVQPRTWLGFSLTRSARRAADRGDAFWSTYLRAVQAVLRAHRDWRVVVESACDQHPVEAIEFTPDEVVERLDAERSAPSYRLALRLAPRR